MKWSRRTRRTRRRQSKEAQLAVSHAKVSAVARSVFASLVLDEGSRGCGDFGGICRLVGRDTRGREREREREPVDFGKVFAYATDERRNEF